MIGREIGLQMYAQSWVSDVARYPLSCTASPRLVEPIYPVNCTCLPASRAHCPVAPSKKILEQHLFQGMCCFFCFRFLFWFMLFLSSSFFSCLFHVGFRFLCVSLLWDSHCFHISPLEFMFSLSLSLFSLVFGSCTAEPLGTRTCRSVHTKTLADDPQV